MLTYSIEIARSIETIDRIFVSTDDKEIAQVALQWDTEVIVRPEELARDNSPEWLAWRHAVGYVEEKYGRFDRFASLPAIAPLREKEDVVNALGAFTDEVDIVVTATEAGNNPFFSMINIDNTGAASLFGQSQERITRRQDAPKVFNLTPVAYVTRPEYILRATGIFDGKVHAVEVPQERAIDVDTHVDFKVAQCLLECKQGGEKIAGS